MKNVLIGITSSIAAYKIPELIRMFKRADYDVKVVMTPGSKNFVTALTLETLSCNRVYEGQFCPRDNTQHISLCAWADVFVVAPLSANTLSKFANGICDNLLTSIFCAYLGEKKPIILVPAMNTGMWENPFVQKNLENLRNSGCEILEPECGFLACGEQNKGRLCELEKIFNAVNNNKPLKGKKIVITSGGTKEPIDPVRFISNASSGKMGTALADCAYEQGADVVLISTNEVQKPYRVTLAQDTSSMLGAVRREFIKNNADFLIMAAAISDYRVKNYSNSKISKEQAGASLTVELVENPDILKTVCKEKSHTQKAIGFCLSSENVLENAKRKIKDKNCDVIIANEVKTALGTDESEVWIIDNSLNVKKIEKTSKINIARKILEILYDKNR